MVKRPSDRKAQQLAPKVRAESMAVTETLKQVDKNVLDLSKTREGNRA